MMKLFLISSKGANPWYRNLDDEREFFKRYYLNLLTSEGVNENIDKRAQMIFSELWCNNDRLLFPETIEVLEYFTSFTASSLVGAGKPSPIIFNAALSAQGVTAGESLYVDDYKLESDGARKQGFTSFLIDRSGENTEIWTIKSLKQLIEYEKESIK